MAIKYDYIIVGAGLSGGIIARRLAEEQGRKVLMLERRDHVAGNMYDYTDELGIKVQKYGPHAFHTSDKRIYELVKKYCDPIPYRTRCEVIIDGINTPSPFNFKTIEQFHDKESANILKQRLRSYYGNYEEVTVLEMLKCDQPDIRNWAQFLFEKDYKPYTAKQWGMDPNEIDESILKRVPIVLSYRDTYFMDEYEWIPRKGFTGFYTNLLNHPNITVKLKSDALSLLEINVDKKCILYEGNPIPVIYTGAIDELFSYRFGILPYRSLYFEFKHLEMSEFQNVAIVAYPQEKAFTRITEYTKMPVQQVSRGTTIAYEYPVPYKKDASVGGEPYYPVLTEKSQRIYELYHQYASKFNDLYLCGRLADFKYYNMDQCIIRALQVYQHIREGNK